MPEYTFEDKNTGEAETLTMKIAEMETYLKENPDKMMVFNKFSLGDPVKLGVTKNSRLLEFQKYVLPKIKKANPLGNIGNGRFDLKREV